jgi:DNA-binding FadR family transcriptional regulator
MGVSRATIREAIGALQLSGLVETRHGAGSYIVDVPPQASVLALPTDASPSALLEARTIFEPQVAALAARAQRKDPEIDRLLNVMAESSDPEDRAQRQRWSDADRAFHRQIAFGTNNVVLIAVADHIAKVMDQPLWRRLRDESIAAPGHTVLYLAEHRLIAAAIAEGDQSAAEFHAGQHLKHARQYMALNE